MTIKEMIKEFQRQWSESSKMYRKIIFDGGYIIATSYSIRDSTVRIYHESSLVGIISLKNVLWIE